MYKQQLPNTDSYRERFASLLNRLSDDKFVIDIGNENVSAGMGISFDELHTGYSFNTYYDREFDPWLLTKGG